MNDNLLFEYAIVRVVPRVERGEFINVGVIVYCKRPAFLKAAFSMDEEKIKAIYPKVDVEEIRAHLHAFERICAGDKDSQPIGGLDTASRFRWLTAKRSTIIQTSETHPGLCEDPSKILDHLLSLYVIG